VEDETTIFKTHWIGICIVLAATFILTMIFFLANKYLRKNIKLSIGKIAIKKFCAQHFSEKIDPYNAQSFETMAQELLALNRRAPETKVDFVKRIARYVDWNIPKHTDFSKIEDKNQNR
jgi:hypothetical protein